MRRTVLVAAALLLAATACGEQVARPDVPEDTGAPESGQSPGGETAEEPREPDPASPQGESPPPEEGGGPDSGTQVLNHYGDEGGFADQRPVEFVATEFTTFSDMEWDLWAAETARGEGEVSGTWCLHEGCQEDPYDVTVVLGDPVQADGTTYFSTYTITDHEDMPQGMLEAMEQADGGRLPVPSTQ